MMIIILSKIKKAWASQAFSNGYMLSILAMISFTSGNTPVSSLE
jgi:hypothetical protein